jgi:hypothetical protein
MTPPLSHEEISNNYYPIISCSTIIIRYDKGAEHILTTWADEKNDSEQVSELLRRLIRKGLNRN